MKKKTLEATVQVRNFTNKRIKIKTIKYKITKKKLKRA